MDLRKVKKLIELVEESGIAELEVSSGDEAIRIAMPRSAVAQTDVAPVPSIAATVPAVAQASPSRSVIAPMAGVFYQAANPEAQPFVTLGQSVKAGDVLCIIESMKMMNEITAMHDGTVTEICEVNGDPVATGLPLFKLS